MSYFINEFTLVGRSLEVMKNFLKNAYTKKCTLNLFETFYIKSNDNK